MSEHTQPETLDREIAGHDAAVAATGVEIWVGAEPTFTRRGSESPEWLSEPLGDEKPRYATAMLGALLARHPGAAVVRSVGRQYAAERRPRWSLGLYERRDGTPAWQGPADPLDTPVATRPASVQALCAQLEADFRGAGWQVLRVQAADPLGQRLALWRPGVAAPSPGDPRLTRPSVHSHKTPADGLIDELAAAGIRLFGIGLAATEPHGQCACIELPAIATVDEFLDCLKVIAEAARRTGVGHLILQGYPPPVDARVAWTTITPDPAVVEVNQAPQPDAAGLHTAMRELYTCAEAIGLSPYRLQYNGTVSDSGGGGQFTLGGRTAATSPFFARPRLLPRLVCYLNQHPVLSYLFAPDYLGGASQSPRTDEGTREAFLELRLALDELRRDDAPGPEFLWASLAPFLADPSGNAHRSELNIEKLWNPHLPGRGRLGLVEFRAFRMPHSAERASALAVLLRAIAAMLTRADPTPALRDWGDELHDRFALPWFLRRDLDAVFDDLAAQGLAIGAALRTHLLQDPARVGWRAPLDGCELQIERAAEFWPLVGDVASQESGGSRTVDSSTTRLQISLRAGGPTAPPLRDWRLFAAGRELPLHDERDGDGELRLVGVRFRDFTPWRGLHPRVPPLGPLRILAFHPALGDAWRLTLHNWQPQGLPYAGLPRDLAEATVRRAERLSIERVAAGEVADELTAPVGAGGRYTVDLRLPVDAPGPT